MKITIKELFIKLLTNLNLSINEKTKDLFSIVLEFIVLLYTIYIFIKLHLEYAKTRNEVNLVLLIILFILSLDSIFCVFSNISFFISGDFVIIMIKKINLHLIFKLSSAAGFLWFNFYIRKQYLWYSLPLNLSFFISIYVFETGNELPAILYIFSVYIISALRLFFNSIRNRNGITFSISGALFCYILYELFGNIFIVGYLMRLFAVGFIIHGINGYFDKTIFTDKEYKREIKSYWISTRVRKKNQKKIKKKLQVD